MQALRIKKKLSLEIKTIKENAEFKKKPKLYLLAKCYYKSFLV